MNPIAEHEANQAAGVKDNDVVKKDAFVGLGDKIVSKTEGDSITTNICPTVKCGEGHVHIYAESGSRKSKVCLNGKEVCAEAT